MVGDVGWIGVRVLGLGPDLHKMTFFNIMLQKLKDRKSVV